MEEQSALVALAALAQETRLDTFRHLIRAGFGGATPGELAEALDVPAPTLSFHLKELKHAGLVHSAREGRTLHYTADFSAMAALLHFLTDDCCQGLRMLEAAGAAQQSDANCPLP